VFGLAIGTAALVLVLSVFNGFEDLISGLFSNFNPDIKIEVVKGKSFIPNEEQIKQISSLDNVLAVSKTLEEVAIFEYSGSQDFGKIKGVDDQFVAVTSIDTTLREGSFLLQKDSIPYAILGAGMRNKLSVHVEDEFSSLTVYTAKKKKSRSSIIPGSGLRKKLIYPSGVFSIHLDVNNEYILSSLAFVQSLLGTNKISALEVKVKNQDELASVVSAIEKIMGAEYTVKNRFRQDEAFLKVMNVEKWMSFAIVSLTLLLIAFNLIGALWMIVLEKKKDIALLKAMGTEDHKIRNIFLWEGSLLCIIGMVSGFLLALILYIAQKTIGIVPIPDGFMVDSYPISVRFTDFLAVGVTVLLIGLLASIPPALRAQRVSEMIREA
jgi:lipoprotein-releasing system permease protein